MIKFIMKKRLLFITFLLIGLGTIILIRVNHTIFLDEQKSVYDNINKMVQSTLNGIKQDALSFSLAATAFPTLKEAILSKNQEAVMEILNELNDNLNKSFKNDNIRIQILTKEQLFCTNKEEHFSFESYQHYFNTIYKELEHNKSSIIQTNNSIKVTTAILEDTEIIAFFDIRILYDVLVQNMRKHKIEIIPLFNKQEDVTVLQDHTLSLNDSFSIGNNNYNQTLLNQFMTLLPKDLEELLTREYLYTNGLFYAVYDIKNSKANTSSKFVAIIKEEIFDDINNKQDSFLENIVTINNTSEDFYNFVKHKDENMFLNIEKGYIKNLKDVIDEKDKLEFEEIARQKLLNLSKEELVDFILQQSKHSEIKGQIK